MYVEFLVAFLPLLGLFACLLQLSVLQVAKLVTLHAASCAARAAVVVLHDDPAAYAGVPVGRPIAARRSAIERAAAIALGAASGIVSFRLRLAAGPDRHEPQEFGPEDMVRVRIEAEFECDVPLASRVVCSVGDGRATLAGEAALPNHGARYPYD